MIKRGAVVRPMSLSYDDIGYKVSMKSKGEITADSCGLSFFSVFMQHK